MEAEWAARDEQGPILQTVCITRAADTGKQGVRHWKTKHSTHSIVNQY
jgi:hypothetical protein